MTAQLNETVVRAWLAERANQILRGNASLIAVKIVLESESGPYSVYLQGRDGFGELTTVVGATIEETEADLAARVKSPEQLVADKRATAARLLAQAEVIEQSRAQAPKEAA